MGNRRPSLPLQILTGFILGAAWLLTKSIRKHAGDDNSEPHYPLRYKRAGVLSLLLYAADVYAIPAVLRNKPKINAEELASLQPDQISFPDGIALSLDEENRAHYKKLSDRVLVGIIFLPLFLLAERRIRRDAASLGMLYLWLHALTYFIYSYSPLGPAFIDKYRPVVYYRQIPKKEKERGNNRNAFYSGHTGNAACASFFMAKVYHDYHSDPGQTAGSRLYLWALLPPLLLGSLRVRALKHFPSDVLLAILIGGSCGVIVPELNKR